jgi:hypothetical protein
MATREPEVKNPINGEIHIYDMIKSEDVENFFCKSDEEGQGEGGQNKLQGRGQGQER